MARACLKAKNKTMLSRKGILEPDCTQEGF